MALVAEAFRLHLSKNGSVPSVAKTCRIKFEMWKTVVCPDYKDSQWLDVLSYMKSVKWIAQGEPEVHGITSILPKPLRRIGMIEERTWSTRGIVEPVLSKKRSFRQAQFYEKFEEMKRAKAKKKKKLIKTQEDVYTKLKKKQNRVYIPKGIPRENLSKSLRDAINENSKTGLNAVSKKMRPRMRNAKGVRTNKVKSESDRLRMKINMPPGVRAPPKPWQQRTWRNSSRNENLIKQEEESSSSRYCYHANFLMKKEKSVGRSWNRRNNSNSGKRGEQPNLFRGSRLNPSRESSGEKRRGTPLELFSDSFSRRNLLDTRLGHRPSRQYDNVSERRRSRTEVKREERHIHDEPNERRERQDYISCKPRRRN